MNILLVEDNIAIQSSLSDFLENNNHSVTSREDGEKALALLKKVKFDIVLSDVHMPLLSGLQLLEEIKQDPELKDTIVILYTGHGEVKSAVGAIKQGAYDYLVKPIDIYELDLKLQRASELIRLRNENRDLSSQYQKKFQEARKNYESKLENYKQAFNYTVQRDDFILQSSVMKKIMKKVYTLHENPQIPVLIEGETGTGKELIAKFLHYGEENLESPLVIVNCAAINPNLFESELFGYQAGAFTGGSPKGQKGKVEVAENGTLFLDEISEIPLDIQAKLLRLIQEGEYYKVGGTQLYRSRARFIGTSNQFLEKIVQKGDFRKDLYYRFSSGHIKIPPLRERKEDIIPLVKLFLNRYQVIKKTDYNNISGEVLDLLVSYSWPGNVRELKHLIDHLVLFGQGDTVQLKDVESFLKKENQFTGKQETQSKALNSYFKLPDEQLDLKKFILHIVEKALNKFQGNQTQTARYLNISLRTLHTHIKHLKEKKYS